MAEGGRRWWGRYKRNINGFVINEKLRDEKRREGVPGTKRDDEDDEMQRNQLSFLC